MSDSNSGDDSSQSDPGVPLFNSISLSDLNAEPPHPDFDRWGDAIEIYTDDFASASQQAHGESDDFWEYSVLGDLIAIEEEQSISSPTIENSNVNLDWEHVLPINDYLEESLTEILMFDVDNQPQLGARGRSASKKLVENLPLVVLRKEDTIVCAICRDEFEEGEIANKLPCAHFYHRACIFPWLEINNTCPVCRYELPTDDRRRSRSRSRTS